MIKVIKHWKGRDGLGMPTMQSRVPLKLNADPRTWGSKTVHERILAVSLLNGLLQDRNDLKQFTKYNWSY